MKKNKNTIPGQRNEGVESNVSRRAFTKGLLAAGVAGLTSPVSLVAGASNAATPKQLVVDYIVVGGGAGGGPVAARLAQAGYQVVLLEAGIDPAGQEATANDPNAGVIYGVPAFLAAAAEYPQLSWDFYVKHYSDPVQQARDSKFVPGKGILYPRGSALGGSTAHNAMVFAYPHDSDWDEIARSTGDDSWRAQNMRRYFERVENCGYCQPNEVGHGYKGYIPASVFDDQIFKLYPELQEIAEGGMTLPSSYYKGNTNLDVNHPLVAKGDTGSFKSPMHVSQGVRISIREYLLETQSKYPKNLYLVTGALATRILTKGKHAVGVEYMRGPDLYEADKNFNEAEKPHVSRIYARREVIVSSGVFNTPQLLKLSGIGPAKELKAHGINVVSDLPGVGENLQDRYEISVNVELKEPIKFYSRCKTFQASDPCRDAYATGIWEGAQQPFYGPYANNAIFGSRILKSGPHRTLPDIFITGLAIPYRGIFPGFSRVVPGNSWSWLVLKCHTNNTAGSVRLKSADPRRMPDINFRYFEEGNDRSGDDLKAVIEGLKAARNYLADPRASKYVASETYPGAAIQSDAQMAQYIRDESWGHHAMCTAKIGGDKDPMAVLDSQFRVRGVERLRVVDASAFPRVPGFFPVAAVMMAGEKAADSILEDANTRRVIELQISQLL